MMLTIWATEESVRWGGLLQNRLRVGLSRLERVVRERMSIQDLERATPSALINIRPVKPIAVENFRFFAAFTVMDPTNRWQS